PVVGLLAATSFAAETTAARALGLKGVTSVIVPSGIPGGPTTGGPTSTEFAIVPMPDDRPEYQKAIFVKSDQQGKDEVTLPPGKYWLGPKAKAIAPASYLPGSIDISERVVVVQEGVFTDIDLLGVGYAP